MLNTNSKGRDERLLQLCDLSFAEAHREHARFLPPTEILERGGCLLTASGTRSPMAPFNGAMALGPRAPDPSSFLRDAAAFFAQRKRGFGVVVREHLDGSLAAACEARGLTQVSESPGMVLSDKPGRLRLAKGISLRTVQSPAEAEHFVAVSAGAYVSLGLPAGVTRKLLSQSANWLTPQWHVEVLYQNEAPVAAAMLLRSHGIAGVHWVGTVPSARGRGYAAAVTASLCRFAFEHGAPIVVLQASPFGEPVYRRLGFRTVTRYPSYLNLSSKN